MTSPEFCLEAERSVSRERLFESAREWTKGDSKINFTKLEADLPLKQVNQIILPKI